MKKKRKSLYVGLLSVAFLSAILSCPKAAEAAPSLTEEQEMQQPDGTAFKGTQYGDEFFSYVAGEDGSVYERKEDNYWYYKVEGANARSVGAKVGIDPKPVKVVQQDEIIEQKASTVERQTFDQSLKRQATTKWNQQQNLLVVRVEFSDVKLSFSEDEWYQKLFSTEGNTLKSFYLEQTNKKIDIQPAKDTEYVKNGILTVRLDQEHPDTREGIGFDTNKFTGEVLKKIKDQVDFSSYNTNGNDLIEPDELHVMFIVAGYERSGGNFGKGVWGHKGWPVKTAILNDGVRVTDFTMFGEKMQALNDYSSTIGVICHEFGHDLGLPDLYNIDNISGAGIGQTSLMSHGSWGAVDYHNGMYWEWEYSGSTPVGLDAYSKVQLGMPFEELDSDQLYEKKMRALSKDSDSTILKLQTQNPNEYFLIENRQLTGFDRGMIRHVKEMSGGISIYLVNTKYKQNHRNDMQLVTSLEADEGLIGYSRYRKGSMGNSNPFYYKGKSIIEDLQQQNQVTKVTSPSTKLSDGSLFDTEITVLSDSANEMTVRIGLPVALKEINLSLNELVLEVGEAKQLQATFIPENATDKPLSWASSNDAIASVDETGKISANRAGNVKITAKNSDGTVSATCEVTVKEKPVAVEDIVINRNLSLMIDEEKKADFSLVPENASIAVLDFEIEDTSIATVDKTGIVTGKKNGQTKLIISTKDQLKKKELRVLVGDDYPNAKDIAEKIDINTEYEGVINFYNDEDWFEVERPADGSDLMVKIGRKGYSNLPTVVGEYQDMSGTWRAFPSYQTAPYAMDENDDFFITLLSSIEYQKIRFNVKYTSGLASMQEYTVKVTSYDQSKITKPATAQIVYEVSVGETIQLDIKNKNGFMNKVGNSLGSSGKNSLFEFTEDLKVTGISPGKYQWAFYDPVFQNERTTITLIVKDDYSNFKDQAEKLELNKEYEGAINYYEDEDWFEVERPADGSDLMVKIGRKGYSNLPTVVREYQDMSGTWRAFPSYQTAPYAMDENNDFFITMLSSIEYQRIRFNVKYTSGLASMQEYTVKVMTYDQSKITKPVTAQTVYEVAVGETIQLDIKNTNGFMGKVGTSQGSSGKNSLFEFTEDLKVTGISPGKYQWTFYDPIFQNERITITINVTE